MTTSYDFEEYLKQARQSIDGSALIVFDLETGGLNGPIEDGKLGMKDYPILEAAMAVVDSDLNYLIPPTTFVVSHTFETLNGMSEWAKDTHIKSGLFDKCLSSDLSLQEVESRIIRTMKACGIEEYHRRNRTGGILLGNSFHFDRDYIMCQMPILNEYVHYRQVDLSGIDILRRLWAPCMDGVKHKTYKHEALVDIMETIKEAKVYRKWFRRIQKLNNFRFWR